MEECFSPLAENCIPFVALYLEQIVLQIVLIISSFKQFFEQSLVQTIVPFALDTVFIENSSRFNSIFRI